MQNTETFSSIFGEGRKLVKEYITTRLEIYRLELIRGFSRAAGYILWLLVLALLLLLLIIFGGIVTGLWLSELTGSYLKGFGLTTGLLILVIVILAMFRKKLFIDPIIRNMIRNTMKNETGTNN